jgi:hypothetical protein
VATAAANRSRAALADTSRGDPMNLGAPPAVPQGSGPAYARPATPPPARDASQPNIVVQPQAFPGMSGPMPGYHGPGHGPGMSGPMGHVHGGYPANAAHAPGAHAPGAARKSPIIWIVVAVLAVAAATGAVLALAL